MKNPLLQFIWANVCYLFSGNLRTKHGNAPKKDHLVPEDFTCIGVATSANAETDAYIITELQALSIQRVRLDFTYDDMSNHVHRFLINLLDAGFKVHLHIVQPFDAAKRMETGNAQQKWRDFIKEICTLYGSRIALIEIGSTINRKRWAGYTMQGFLNTWDIAYKEIKSRNIVLAGPSVTDFEPLYNIGFLSILKSRNQLPDIHTNNLFSERCTEPERDDHKVLGRRLAKFANFRHIKKAYILQEIGQYFGVPTFHSPSAFWTLPRIERLLPDGLEKQADYLSRYMILSAASGVMQSVAWGPLICHREGLVDDANTTYPTLERITHYQSVNNQVDAYQKRPALKAYQAFNTRIPGMRYLSKLNVTDHLEMHAFVSDSMQLHAVWATNAKAVILNECYLEGALDDAVVFDRDGQKITMPSMVTESPIYIQFDADKEVVLASQARIVKDLSIHAHAPHVDYHDYHEGNWHGIIAAKDKVESTLLAKALDPSKMQGPSQATSLRRARNAIWTMTDPRDPTKKLVVKQPVKVPWYKKITDHRKPSKALRSWNGANELLRRGIENAAPIAYFELDSDSTRTHNYYICEYVPSDFSAREVFTCFANGNKEYAGFTQQEVYAQVVDYLFKMHSRGVFFRDLSGGNILMRKIDGKTLQFSLIDTGRAYFFNHPASMADRWSDMARACNKLHTEGRNALMSLYMAKMQKTFGWQEKLPFIIYNAKVILKRNTKRKNILKALGFK